MTSLKQLSNIKPLQEISALQQTVQTLARQTNELGQKEQARSQDFMTLYNMTLVTKTRLAILDSGVDRRIHDLVQN